MQSQQPTITRDSPPEASDAVDVAGGCSPVTRRFLTLVLPPLVITLAAVGLGVYFDLTNDLKRLHARESARVELAARQLGREIQVRVGDLRQLAGDAALARLLEQDAPERRAELASGLLNLLAAKGVYDQARYLDRHGMEIVRVNWNGGRPEVVPRERLQDKSRRYYFSKAALLDPGEVFISPFDLNMEKGVVERPFKPTIRLATPVVDGEGRKRGIVVLNYLGEGLLGRFRADTSIDGGHGMLLDREGYWLAAPDPADEWGFMFGSGRRFSARHPEAWRRLRAAGEGRVETAAGLFSYSTAYPLNGDAGFTQRPEGASPYRWTVVRLVPREALPSPSDPRYQLVAWATILLLLLLAAVGWRFAQARAARDFDHLSLRESRRRLQEITDTIAEGVLVIDREGRVRFANLAAQRLLGYGAEEMIGRDAHGLFHYHTADGRHIPTDACPIYRSILRGELWRGDDELFWDRNGNPLAVSVSSSPIVREGICEGTVLAFHDIRQRKHMETDLRAGKEELERVNAELAALLDERSAALQHHLVTDELTGLPNRVRLQRDLTRDEEGCVILVNLDNLARINAGFGFQAGDWVLQQSAALLRDLVPNGASVYRIAGDEFLAFLPMAEVEIGRRVAQCIKEKLAGQTLSLSEGTYIPVTHTIGVAAGHGDGLLDRARVAITEARRYGYNRLGEYRDEGATAAGEQDTLGWIHRVRGALRERRIVVHFQPIVDNRHGGVAKFEALARLREGEGEAAVLVSPGHFIGPARLGGLMPQLTGMVIDRVIEAMADNDHVFSVNITDEDLRDGDLLGRMTAEVEGGRVVPSRLVFEVLEGITLDDSGDTMEALRGLKALGFGIAVDDFGAEQSHFSRLPALQADILKIDGRFIRDLDTNPTSRLITHAIARLADGLGIEVVAEFVHGPEIQRHIEEMGIRYSQGYFHGEPGAEPWRGQAVDNAARH